jgi:hypothetical protein
MSKWECLTLMVIAVSMAAAGIVSIIWGSGAAP